MEPTCLHQVTDSECSAVQTPIWADILAQAVTGELIGALNYMTLADLYEDHAEKAEAIEHAEGEKGHAASFSAAARELGIDVVVDTQARYWGRIRAAFVSRSQAGDLVDCILAQEVMLESFAVASYQVAAKAAPGKLGATFARIATEEEEHVSHAIALLRAERALNADAFDARVHRMHLEIMTVLAEMVSKEDPGGHCGLCKGSCVKPSLPHAGINLSEVRGASLQRYLKTLDEIGVPGESSLVWVTQLPV
jgi:fatty aldehyde decarbonylase